MTYYFLSRFKYTNPDDYSYAPSGLMVQFINFTFRADFMTVFLSFILLFYLCVLFFACLLKLAGIIRAECIVSGIDDDEGTTSFAEGFALSWTTFTTVGYGGIYPDNGNDRHRCSLIIFLCTAESFTGLLFSGMCTAIMFAKVGRIQSHAQVTFSDGVCVEYGQLDNNITEENNNNQRQSHNTRNIREQFIADNRKNLRNISTEEEDCTTIKESEGEQNPLTHDQVREKTATTTTTMEKDIDDDDDDNKNNNSNTTSTTIQSSSGINTENTTTTRKSSEEEIIIAVVQKDIILEIMSYWDILTLHKYEVISKQWQNWCRLVMELKALLMDKKKMKQRTYHDKYGGLGIVALTTPSLPNERKAFTERDELRHIVRLYCDRTDLEYIAQTYGYPIGTWDISQITDLSLLFAFQMNFSNYDSSNSSIGQWDTSSVNIMSYMFHYATSFNQNLSKWDTSSVTHMVGMFDNATSYTGIGIQQWNTSNVIDMSNMFTNCLNLQRTQQNNIMNCWNTNNTTTTTDDDQNNTNKSNMFQTNPHSILSRFTSSSSSSQPFWKNHDDNEVEEDDINTAATAADQEEEGSCINRKSEDDDNNKDDEKVE